LRWRSCLTPLAPAEFNSAKFKGVHHVAIICEDLERSMRFYVDLLGAVKGWGSRGGGWKGRLDDRKRSRLPSLRLNPSHPQALP